MKPSKSAVKLKALIKKAIDDHVITREEYEAIMDLANQDSIIDSEEKKLLENFHHLIENKTIKRMP